MVEIGIPVYKARDTLPDLLDTIVAQTRKTIIVCLSIDGDDIDYSDIIETYRARGLRIRVINSPENGGPGIARQRILNTTQCPYIMFADSDDLLMPRAVESLYRGAVCGGYDILRSHFVRESSSGPDLLLRARDATVTWFHGKIYRTQYLKNLGVRMLPDLPVDEDAYFNLIAWYGTEKHGFVDEITYIWRDNKSSLTRNKTPEQYFKEKHSYYIQSQIKAFQFLFEHNIQIVDKLIGDTLINLYYYYMKAKYYGCDLQKLDNLLYELHGAPRILEWYNKMENWVAILEGLKAGIQCEDKNIIFFQEPFSVWVTRLLIN